MKKILAVSGGVDSMVLLDIFKNDPDILVAHFNHGTRKSADADEIFVKKRCEELGVPLTVGHSALGPGASEEKAREARYDFLFSLSDSIREKLNGEEVLIFTAHHLDDLIESVMINLLRGTAWRGLTPFSRPGIFRPFLNDDLLMPESKADILTYAAHRKITFREDPTNTSEKYFRNRIRAKIKTLDPEEHFLLNQKIKALYFSQRSLRDEIAKILNSILPEDGTFERKWFFEMDDNVAVEILRAAFLRKNISLTNPTLLDFLSAIRNFEPEKKFNLPEDRLITIHKNYFKI